MSDVTTSSDVRAEPFGNGAAQYLEEAQRTSEHLGLRTFRPPPARAMLFGAIYGSVLGAIVAWDIAVLIRLGRSARNMVRRS